MLWFDAEKSLLCWEQQFDFWHVEGPTISMLLSKQCLAGNVKTHVFIPGKQWLLFDLYGKASQFLSKRYFSGRDTTHGNLTFYLVCSTDEITLYYWHRISVPTLILPLFYVCLHCFLYFHTKICHIFYVVQDILTLHVFFLMKSLYPIH